MSILGTRVIRTEDPRLLTAGGVYVDDLREPELAGAVRATFVRSTVAHALITGIDASEALAQPGVVAVLTAADMTDMPPPPPAEEPPPDAPPAEGPVPLGGKWSEPLLAVDRVRFVGEPVAIVLTESTYQGEDAAELVSVDYEQLPAVPSIEAALADDSLLFPDAGTNVCTKGGGDISDDSIFDGCDVIVEGDVVNQRVACLPMEGRSTAAAFVNGKLTVWASSQNAQIARLILTAIGLPPDAIRVVAPDVGGGFGAKIGVDRESIIVAWAAKHTGRPVRWVETRNENLLSMTQGRAQIHHIKIGGSRDGHIKAYRLDVIQDTGAYPRMSGFLPMLTNLMAPGVYDIPNVQAAYKVVVTDGTPIAAYRGAGRPEAAATIERAVDWFAAEAGLDPAEVRKDQLHPAGPVPVRHQDRRAVRHRRVRVGAGQGARGRGLRVAARRAEAPPGGRRHRAARHRAGQLRGDHRRRRRRGRDREGRGARRRHRHRLHRQLGARPGPPHRVRDAGAGRARHPDGEDRGHPRRHRPDPGRHRHLRVPLAAAGRLGRAEGGDRGQGGGGQERGRSLRGRRSRRGARHGHRHVAHRRRPGQVAHLGAGRGPRGRRADRRERPVHRRTGRRSRSARTCRWSRSTPRPAR